MARPIEKGLKYFPFDIDFFDDDKIAFVSARFQEKGELIAIKLLCKIYKDNGYYYQWGEDEAVLFAKRVVGDASRHALVNDVVHELIKRDFFDKDIFDRFEILTSRGIQKRYEKICKDSNRVYEIDEKISLVRGNPLLNPTKPPIKSVKSTQSKEKEIKEKEIKEKESSEEQPPILIVEKPLKPKKRQQPDALQFTFSSIKFIEAWNNLVAMPKWEKKLPLSLQMSLDRLSKYDEDFAIELIKRAIEGDYQGVTFDDTDSKYSKWKVKQGDCGKILKPTEERKQSILEKFEANAN